ncbi:Hypothetical protein D9617_6g094640 [Elsinoe fawcettii]|nr:Hypothetical protein D9617_6g094640 [Elsinoe fawcettii]
MCSPTQISPPPDERPLILILLSLLCFFLSRPVVYPARTLVKILTPKERFPVSEDCPTYFPCQPILPRGPPAPIVPWTAAPTVTSKGAIASRDQSQARIFSLPQEIRDEIWNLSVGHSKILLRLEREAREDEDYTNDYGPRLYPTVYGYVSPSGLEAFDNRLHRQGDRWIGAKCQLRGYKDFDSSTDEWVLSSWSRETALPFGTPCGFLALPLSCRRIFSETMTRLLDENIFVFTKFRDIMSLEQWMLPEQLERIRRLQLHLQFKELLPELDTGGQTHLWEIRRREAWHQYQQFWKHVDALKGLHHLDICLTIPKDWSHPPSPYRYPLEMVIEPVRKIRIPSRFEFRINAKEDVIALVKPIKGCEIISTNT